MDQRRSYHPAESTAGGTLRVAPLVGIPALLRELGCDPTAILSQVGLPGTLFDDPETRMTYRAGGELLKRCVAATQCEHFGLLLGSRVDPSALGLLAQLIQTAPDVGSALGALVQHFALHDRGSIATLDTTPSSAVLGYAVFAEAPGIAAAHDLSMAVAANLLRALCGPEWQATEVALSRRRPRDVAPYRAFFRAPLTFDREHSTIAFPARWLKHRFAAHDPAAHRALQGHAEAEGARETRALRAELHALVRHIMIRGRGSAREAARQLGIHERTLNRRLRSEGTTFHRELDAVRYAMAQQYLQETSMSLAEIAEALGFGDASAFNRAFKRWSGTTPARFRKPGDADA